MSILKWKPYNEMVDFYNRVNRIFDDDFFGRSNEQSIRAGTWIPPMDVYESQDDYVMKIEVPGLSKDDVKVELNNGTMTIRGERKEEKEIKKEDYHRVERFYGSFTRSFQLPQNADITKVNANMREGVLELKIHKREEAKTKSIEISVE